MTSRRVFLKWSLIGLATGLFLALIQAQAVGGVAGMLQVGETSSLRPLIEAQLGEIPLSANRGHDGQIFYAIGIDLDGDVVAPLLDHASYRYRRILFPLLASGFGLLSGWPLLYAMIGLNVLAMGFCAGLVAVMASAAGKSELLVLAVLVNPGVWLSVQLLTSDVVALALMVFGLYAFTRRSPMRAPWFSLSGLAKDVSMATPLPLGLRARDLKVSLIPVAALIAWMTFLEARFGEGFASRGNLDWPFWGLVEASRNWTFVDSKEWVYLATALLTVALGIAFSFRQTWLRWPIVAWTGLAIISSNWVWDFGNNAVRAFAPILVLVVLSGSYVVTPPASECMTDRVGA